MDLYQRLLGTGPGTEQGRAHERTCVCVCVCVCVLGWESGPRKKGPVGCGSVSVSLGGCVGGRSEACLPPSHCTCPSARPAPHCSVSLFALLCFFNLATLRGSTKVWPSVSAPRPQPHAAQQGWLTLRYRGSSVGMAGGDVGITSKRPPPQCPLPVVGGQRALRNQS